MPAKTKSILEQLESEIDAEPKAAKVLARVMRLERVVEKQSGKTLDEMMPAPAAPAATSPNPS